MSIRVEHGDSRDVLKTLPDGSVDSVVTDPPYALTANKKGGSGVASVNLESPYGRARIGTGNGAGGFMGKKWDTGETAFDPAFWVEVLRVLKPGGHLIAFGGTRTYHRLVCAIEDAGFEIRDQLAWIFGSGFPKSHDVSKGIDKAAGITPEDTGVGFNAAGIGTSNGGSIFRSDHPEYKRPERVTDNARQWQGWGTALKPAQEPICLARKPLGSPAIDVRGIVERQLRERGVDGEIRWSKESVSGAARPEKLQTSLSTAAPPAVETSAVRADVNGMLSADLPTGRDSAKRIRRGEKASPSLLSKVEREQTNASATKSSQHTAAPALVAERASGGSSPLTTSAAAERLTESAPTERSTPNCADRDSQPDTESFAGIATGLTGSTERVLISRKADGTFAWPEGVPAFVSASSLTVAANVLKHGTGALNIDASRIESGADHAAKCASVVGLASNRTGDVYGEWSGARTDSHSALGRWPANVIHDGSPEVLAGFPDTGLSSGGSGSASQRTALAGHVYGEYSGSALGANAGGIGDSGSAARFFYTPKADKLDRLESKHPTVKPVDLMAYLIKLVTPPGGTVLDPFAGSGSTGMAAMREGFNAILIEREAEYVADIRRRLDHVHGHDTPLFAELSA